MSYRRGEPRLSNAVSLLDKSSSVRGEDSRDPDNRFRYASTIHEQVSSLRDLRDFILLGLLFYNLALLLLRRQCPQLQRMYPSLLLELLL